MRTCHHLLLLSLALLINPIHATLPERFFGDVYDKAGNLVYTEEHNVISQGNRIVEIKTQIFDLQKNILAVISSRFNSEPYLPNFYSDRITDGFISRAIREGEKITLLKKEPKWREYIFKTFSVEPNMVVGHGYYFFLIDHLSELLNDQKTIDISILIPNRLAKETFSMSGVKEPGDPNIAVITLVPRNPFHRLVIPEIIFKINLKNKWLVSFEGPNTFLDMKKIIPYIKIQYHE